MRAVGIKELKKRLSEYVRLAAGGQTVLVTDRDRVVAELSPPREGRAPAVQDAIIAELVREGVMTPALIRSSDPPPRRPIGKLKDILRTLDEGRSDR